jgi:hypothetical protein
MAACFLNLPNLFFPTVHYHLNPPYPPAAYSLNRRKSVFVNLDSGDAVCIRPESLPPPLPPPPPSTPEVQIKSELIPRSFESS